MARASAASPATAMTGATASLPSSSRGSDNWRRSCSSGFYRRAELFRDRRRFLGDVPAVRLGVFLGQLLLDLKHLFDLRVRFPVGPGQLDGGRTADVVCNRFLHASADVAHVALDHGGDARLSVLAVGCDEVLAEDDPLTSVAGLDVGRLRFVMEAVGEFVGERVAYHRFEHGAVVTQGGVIDPDVTYL